MAKCCWEHFLPYESGACGKGCLKPSPSHKPIDLNFPYIWAANNSPAYDLNMWMNQYIPSSPPLPVTYIDEAGASADYSGSSTPDEISDEGPYDDLPF